MRFITTLQDDSYGEPLVYVTTRMPQIERANGGTNGEEELMYFHDSNGEHIIPLDHITMISIARE